MNGVGATDYLPHFRWKRGEKMDYEECPDCGNKNLKIYEQVNAYRVTSARTGKVLRRLRAGEGVCFNHFCKCGWSSDIKVEDEGEDE